MAELIDWARDLLVSRGALVETEDAGSLRAMLSPELAGVLQASDWLSLRFGTEAGSDDSGDWLERFGRLLPPDARVCCTRLRHPQPAAYSVTQHCHAVRITSRHRRVSIFFIKKRIGRQEAADPFVEFL